MYIIFVSNIHSYIDVSKIVSLTKKSVVAIFVYDLDSNLIGTGTGFFISNNRIVTLI